VYDSGFDPFEVFIVKLLTAAYVLPISQPAIADGAVLIDEDGQIAEVGPSAPLAAQNPGAAVEDFPHAVLMPGLVNAHTHLDLMNFDGKAASGESLEFFDWLTLGWNHRRSLTPAARRQCLDDGIRQLLRSGTTCVGDAGQYVGVIAQAANSPMRMVLFPELLTGGDAGILDGYEGVFSQVDEILDCKSTRLSPGIAPYAAYTLSRHLLKILSQHARELRIPCKIHVAETFSEMQFFYESSGEIAERLFPAMGWANQLPPEHRKTPIQYLDSIGFLENATLIGCNHLADNDLEAIARNRAWVVHSPRSNARLKLGNPPLKKLRGAGIHVALGTDGTGALYSLSLWDEMRFLRNHYPEAEQPPADDLLRMATLEGAKALKLGDRIGSLERGKEADLIAVRLPADATAKKLAEGLIANTTDREIAAVYVEGKRVKLL
jgi:cytosine/adenosine deaminase-related metal-dependent hydrolase